MSTGAQLSWPLLQEATGFSVPIKARFLSNPFIIRVPLFLLFGF